MERRVKPFVGINGDRIRELQPLAGHRPFMGEQHAATVCGVHVQPHTFAICDPSQFAHGINCASVCSSENADDAHGPHAMPTIFRNGCIQCIQARSKFRIGRQRAQRVSSQAHCVYCLIYRDVPFLRGVHGPTVLNALALDAVAGDEVPGQLDGDKVGHHAAAGQVATCMLIVANQISEPTNRASLDGDGRGPKGVGSDVLIERGADEVGNDPDWAR